jgi:hypothetical protein
MQQKTSQVKRKGRVKRGYLKVVRCTVSIRVVYLLRRSPYSTNWGNVRVLGYTMEEGRELVRKIRPSRILCEKPLFSGESPLKIQRHAPLTAVGNPNCNLKVDKA